MYFYMYTIVGTLWGERVETSVVLYFFVRDGKKYAYTRSHSLYLLEDPLDKISLPLEKRLDMIEIRKRVNVGLSPQKCYGSMN